MNQTDKLELQIQENQDGSAVVSLPGSTPQDTQDDLPEQDTAAADRDSDSGFDEVASQPDSDPEREAIRQARREERQLKKQLHKEKTRESRHLINALRKQNQDLAERLALVEKRTSGAEIAQFNKAIEDAGVQVEFAKLKMAEALSSQNGAEHARAQEAWFEARKKLETLQLMKDAAAKQSQNPKQGIPDPHCAKDGRRVDG